MGKLECQQASEAPFDTSTGGEEDSWQKRHFSSFESKILNTLLAPLEDELLMHPSTSWVLNPWISLRSLCYCPTLQTSLSLSLSLYTYTHTQTYMYIYIYIHIHAIWKLGQFTSSMMFQPSLGRRPRVLAAANYSFQADWGCPLQSSDKWSICTHR